MRFNCGEVRCACRRGDLIFSVDSSREYARDVAPESPVWKERGSGRLRMLDSAQKDAAGVGRLRRSRAAIVCTMLGLDENSEGESLHLSHECIQHRSCTWRMLSGHSTGSYVAAHLAERFSTQGRWRGHQVQSYPATSSSSPHPQTAGNLS
jgi:hypothetical protein